ncbi:MAG TPA: RHS repeat-associated core domain-containing protein [Solirubrobacteraceae bacterium]
MTSDAVEHTVVKSWSLWLDSTDPTMSNVSGSLWRARDGYVGGGDQTVHADAADTLSGVKRVDLLIDGTSVDHVDGDCTTRECKSPKPADLHWNSTTASGRVKVTVHVTDFTDNFVEQSWYVTVVNFVDMLRPASRNKLGLEHWFQYDDTDTGGGSRLFVNAETGNAVWHSVPIVDPGRLSTVVNVTYNSQDRGGVMGSTLGGMPVVDLSDEGVARELPGLSYGPAGVGVSLGISGPARLNEPLGGVLIAQAAEEGTQLPELGEPIPAADGLHITLTDSDGTVHTFTRAGGEWVAPPGLNMHLRRYKKGGTALAPIPEKWAMTRPDGVTHFFDNLGYQTSTRDRTGNSITYVYETYDALTGVKERTVPQTTAKIALCDKATLGLPGGVPLGERLVIPGGPLNGTPVVCARRVVKVVNAGVPQRKQDGTLDSGTRELLVHYPDEPVVLPHYDDPDTFNELPRRLFYASASLVGGRAGQIDWIDDHAGRRYLFGYDDAGYLTSLTEAAGAEQRVTRFEYESWQDGAAQFAQDRQMTRVIAGDAGRATVIRYVRPEDRRNPTGATGATAAGLARVPREVCGVTPRNDGESPLPTTDDPPAKPGGCRTAANDRETTYVYTRDPESNRTTQFAVTDVLSRRPGGGIAQTATTRTDLDPEGRPTTVTDPLGTKTALTWNSLVNAVAVLDQAKGTDEESHTELTYDEQHGTGVLRSQVQFPDWPDTEKKLTTNLDYEFRNGVHHHAAAPLLAPDVEDDGGTYVADLKEIRRPEADTGSSFQVEQDGTITKRWNQPGRTGQPTQTVYGTHGVITSEKDELERTTAFSDFTIGGNPRRVVDPRGGAWDYTYDVRENVTSIVDPRATNRSGNADAHYTTSLDYDAFDRLTLERVPRLSDDTAREETANAGPRYRVHKRTYDRDGNVLTDDDGIATTTIAYGPLGEARTVKAPGDGVTEVTDYVYDAATRLIARIDPEGNHAGASLADDEEPTCTGATAPTARAHVTRYCLDPVGRRVAEIRPAPPTADVAAAITSYAFDRRDNLVGVVDPRRNKGATVMDATRNAASPTGRRTSYGYDRTDRRTVAVQRRTPDEADQTPLRTQYEYDKNGNQTMAWPPSAFHGASRDDAFLTHTFYDPQDRVVAERTPDGCIAYARDKDGSVSSVTSPRGTVDAGDRGCVKDPESDAYTTSYAYDDGGQVISRSIPYATGQYGRDHDEFDEWRITYWRDAAGDAVRVCDARTNAAGGNPCRPRKRLDGQVPPDAGIENRYYDGGELRWTTRPSFYALQWGGGQANPDPGLHFRELDAGMDLEIAQGGPAIGESGDVTRTAAGSDGGSDLPDGPDKSKFGTVDRQDPGDMLPDVGGTSLEYDATMRLTGIVDAAHQRRTIGYDPQGRVLSKSWPFDGDRRTERKYTYDKDGNLTTYRDGTLQLTRFTYDSADRRGAESTPGGSAIDFQPQSGGRQVSTFGYDLNGNLEARKTAVLSALHVVTFSYDSLDRLVAERDPSGARWTYGYDENGNRTCEESPNAGSTTCNPDSPYATEYHYTPADRLERRIAGDGSEASYGYDADGNLEDVSAPGAASHDGGGIIERRTHIANDGRGMPWRVTTSGPDGQDARTVVYEHDPNGNLRRVVNPSGVGADGNPLVRDRTASGGGTETDLANASWHATVRDYDHHDQLTAVRLPWSTPSDADHPAVDHPTGPADPEAHGDGRRLIQRFRRDDTEDAPNPLHRVRTVVSPHEADSDLAPRTSYRYFANGWVRGQSERRDAAATTSEPVSGLEVTYDYDAEGRQTKWTTRHADPANDAPDTPDGRRVERTFNDDGTLFERTAIKPLPKREDGRAAGDTRRTYRYAYNESRSLIGVADYGERQRDLASDSVPPLGSSKILKIERDDAEREHVVDETWEGGLDTVFDYDRDGNVTERQTDGVWSSGDTYRGDDAKTTAFSYDSLDREQTATVTVDGDRRETTTTWWPSGEMRRRTKPNGTVETRYFDVQGQITRKTSDRRPDDPETQDYDYDVDGNRTKDERGALAFNPRGQLVEWTRGSEYESEHPPGESGDTKAGTTVTYKRNESGDVLEKRDTFNENVKPDHEPYGDVVTTYDYEGERLHATDTTVPAQLTAHVYSTYSYDDFGSVKKIETKKTNIPDGPPPAEGPSSPANCKDVPNDAKRGLTRYCFDEFERMALSRGGDVQPTSYRYDAFDRRDRSVDEHGTPHGYSYIGTSRLLSRESEEDKPVKTYDYDSQGRRLGKQSREQGAPRGSKPDFLSYATDANGSVESLEDGDGNIADNGKATYLYDPYGEDEKLPDAELSPEEREKPDSALSTQAHENPFRYEGFYFDSGVKSYDMQAREYRPDSGRFLSQDRFESAVDDQFLQADPLTQNRYAFAGANPVNNVEFDGHMPAPEGAMSNRDGKKGHHHHGGGGGSVGSAIGDGLASVGVAVSSACHCGHAAIAAEAIAAQAAVIADRMTQPPEVVSGRTPRQLTPATSRETRNGFAPIPAPRSDASSYSYDSFGGQPGPRIVKQGECLAPTPKDCVRATMGGDFQPYVEGPRINLDFLIPVIKVIAKVSAWAWENKSTIVGGAAVGCTIVTVGGCAPLGGWATALTFEEGAETYVETGDAGLALKQTGTGLVAGHLKPFNPATKLLGLTRVGRNAARFGRGLGSAERSLGAFSVGVRRTVITTNELPSYGAGLFNDQYWAGRKRETMARP